MQDQIGIAFLRGLFAFARCFGLRKGGQFDCVRLRASGRVTGGEEGVDGTAGSRAEEGTDGPWFGGGADEEALGWCHFRFYGFPLSFHGSFINRSSLAGLDRNRIVLYVKISLLHIDFLGINYYLLMR